MKYDLNTKMAILGYRQIASKYIRRLYNPDPTSLDLLLKMQICLQPMAFGTSGTLLCAKKLPSVLVMNFKKKIISYSEL